MQMLHLWLHLKSDTWAKWREEQDRMGAGGNVVGGQSHDPRKVSGSTGRSRANSSVRGGGGGATAGKGGKRGSSLPWNVGKVVRYRLEGEQDRALANWREPARRAVQVLFFQSCSCVLVHVYG